jgi:hypothetical protein
MPICDASVEIRELQFCLSSVTDFIRSFTQSVPGFYRNFYKHDMLRGIPVVTGITFARGDDYDLT